MRKTLMNSLVMGLLICILILAKSASSQIENKSEERVSRIKQSTVSILVNGKPNGTGFVISKDGLIATCFHVVKMKIRSASASEGLTYAQQIAVKFANGNQISATVHSSCLDAGFAEALSKDYCILQTDTTELLPLPLGNFDDVQEGAEIYTCGFPFGTAQPVVAFGFLSTKYKAVGYQKQGGNRDVAWLDIMMNSGNSGGPILAVGKSINDDRVIGIAAYNLNPFADSAQKLIDAADAFHGQGTYSVLGINFEEFYRLVGQAIKANSSGVGSCVSINYLKKAMQ